MSNTNTTTVCILGTGGISHVHAAGLSKLDDVDIKICNRTRSKAEEFARAHEVSEIVDSVDEVFDRDDIDAVDICVSHDLHLDFCLRALAGGKHVLLEKPMANTLQEADRMIAAAVEADRILSVSENFRFEPAVLKAKQVMDAGDIGRPFMIVINDWFWMAEITAIYPGCDWRRQLEGNAGGVLFDRGVHLTAVMNYLGGPVQTVYGRCMNPQKYWQGDETAIVVGTHKNGIVTNYIQSWNILGVTCREVPLFAVYGTEGSIVEDPGHRVAAHGCYEAGALKITSRKNPAYSGSIVSSEFLAGKAWLENLWRMPIPQNMLEDMVRHGTPWLVPDDYPDYDVYHASVQDFVRAVRGEKAPHVPGSIARDDIAVVFAAYESDKTNSVVTLEG